MYQRNIRGIKKINKGRRAASLAGGQALLASVERKPWCPLEIKYGY